MSVDSILAELVAMSRNLGDPSLDYAILGEGNSSARADAETFWVKASGVEMRTIGADGFVRVRFEPVLAMLRAGEAPVARSIASLAMTTGSPPQRKRPAHRKGSGTPQCALAYPAGQAGTGYSAASDAEVKAGLEAARVDPRPETGRPSVETVLHALALQMEGIHFVGHTHPTAVNAVLCSQKAEEAIAGRLFPDEIVYCGPAPLYIPYTDPGVPLAQAVGRAMADYQAQYGQAPKVILMQNHGLIALGRTALEVEQITAMYVKAFRVLLGAYALGGPHFMSPAAVARIHTRPDEQYRRSLWGKG